MQRAIITAADIGPTRDPDTGRQLGHAPKKFSALRKHGRTRSRLARKAGLEHGFTQGARRRLSGGR